MQSMRRQDLRSKLCRLQASGSVMKSLKASYCKKEVEENAATFIYKIKKGWQFKISNMKVTQTFFHLLVFDQETKTSTMQKQH